MNYDSKIRNKIVLYLYYFNYQISYYYLFLFIFISSFLADMYIYTLLWYISVCINV